MTDAWNGSRSTRSSVAAGRASAGCVSAFSDVLDVMAVGDSEADVLKDYPDLEAEDIRAALRYASRNLDHPVLVA